MLSRSLRRTRQALGVRPSHVVQLAEPSAGCSVAEGAVWSTPVIELEPAGQAGGALGARAVDRAVGPAAEQRADEALGFAVRARPVGPRAQVPQPERAAGERVQRRAVR